MRRSAKRSRNQRHANKLGQAAGLHFVHKVGAIDFHRAQTDAEIKGDLLVGVARYQAIEYVALAF